MKIATFNANSLRARLDIIIDWLNQYAPDVLCIQETKVQDKDFPIAALGDAGYDVVFKGQKSYNGVAILSRLPIENVRFGFDDEPKDEPRIIAADISGISFVNTYVPQGREVDSDMYLYKLQWYKRLRLYFEKHFEPLDSVIWLGDLNVALTDKDVHSPDRLRGHVCFNPELTELFTEVADFGFVDLFRLHCDEGGQYTFWDYRATNGFERNVGWRIDYIMATKPLAERCRSCYVDRTPRGLEKPSDHTFLIAEFA
ncbi:MAG: exodeoxyribonuclease III [Anaerohalosphaeraceae bacterium]|nr:exodeoxyribonuclease III [Anaerohalosphaeraceae bacterium]